MQEPKVLRKNPDMVARVMGDETILVPIYRTSKDIDCIYTLDKVTSRVWQMLDGKTTLAEIKTKLLKDFDTTPLEVDKQMREFLKDLKEIKAIK